MQVIDHQFDDQFQPGDDGRFLQNILATRPGKDEIGQGESRPGGDQAPGNGFQDTSQF